MQKTTRTLLAVIVVVAAGGGLYYFVPDEDVESVPGEIRQTPISQEAASKTLTNDLIQRKLEGIGNTRDLPPHPLP